MKKTQYTLASFLKGLGYKAVTNPYEMARDGAIVYILVKNNKALENCQRSYYQRIITGGDEIERAKRGTIYFSSNGRLVIITPKVDIDMFLGYPEIDRYYYIYNG